MWLAIYSWLICHIWNRQRTPRSKVKCNIIHDNSTSNIYNISIHREKANIYRYVIQYIAIAILMIFNVIYYKKKLKNNYTIQNLILLIEMLVFTYEACTILTIVFTLLSIAIKMIIEKIKGISRRNIKNNKQTQIPFGFYLCVTNIITLLITNILIFYR